jgi:hypothetical protein
MAAAARVAPSMAFDCIADLSLIKDGILAICVPLEKVDTPKLLNHR